MTARQLIREYCIGKFKKGETYKDIGHDFIKAIKPLNLPYEVSSGLYISTQLLLDNFDGDVDNLIFWIEEGLFPSLCGSELSKNICWNLYYWLKLSD